MFYKNTSYTEKTFYGVKFKPGETKEVDGIISNRWMIPCSDSATDTPKVMQQKPSSEEASKEVAEAEKPSVSEVAEPEPGTAPEPQPAKEEKSSRNKERKA